MINKVFRFAAGCSVADGDGFNFIGFYHLAEFGGRFTGFIDRRMRVDILIVQQVALRIEADDFAAGTESGVDGEHPFLSERRREKQLAEILRKYADSFVVGFFFGLGGKFCFDGRFEQTVICVGSGFLYLMAAFIIAMYELAVEAFQTGFVIRTDGYFQQPFGFCPADGEQAMGSAAFQRFGEVEIIPVLGGLFLFSFHYLGGDFRLTGELVTYGVAGTLVLVHLLRDDVTGTFQCVFRILYVAFDEGGGFGGEVRLPLQHHDHGQRFQSFLAGRFGTGLPFGFVGEVDVLQFRRIPGGVDALFELRSQFPLLVDGTEDGFLPFGYVAQLVMLLLDVLYLYFVQSAGSFLTVTADERDGGTFVQQVEGTADLSFRYPQ